MTRQQGLTLEWPEYSAGEYGAAQKAERTGRSIRKGSYVEP